MSSDNGNDELDSLESAIYDLEKVVPELLDARQEAPSVYEQIAELRQQAATLIGENQELRDLLRVAEEECIGFKLKICGMGEQIQELQRHKKNSKEDIKSLRKEKKGLEQSIERLVCLLDDVVISLQREQPVAVPDSAVILPFSRPLATGVFIACGDDFWARQNTRRLGVFSKGCPEIGFLEAPILVLSGSQYPPIPKVDVVVLFTPGLTHADSDTVRAAVKNMGVHFIEGHRATFMIQILNEWVKNPTFASTTFA